ncbi:glucose 1-dehydrogenase [Planktotalea sp.]|uniref:SDR family NAD(P)-dependent oxidoreductase n=1 Tax=Planktotalea sp. TaxID=2029877 RepID=UPI0025F23D67|nr:glucose 1-dehydrogenase [Planktotalea sp.]
MNRLDGKVAMITGGARGMGAAEASLFAKAGATVIITDIDVELGKDVAESVGASCEFMLQDVSQERDWDRVLSKILSDHGRIDVLVNNAGIFDVVGLEETSLETWDRVVAINQTGTFLGIRSVIPTMKTQRAGSIINLSSIAGLAGTPRAPAYSATKWAVRGLTKSAALEFAPFGVRINSVHPGLIETRMMDALDQSPEERDARVPLGKQGTVEEVARMVMFLASDDSSHCSGHEFVVDGALKA